MTRRLFSLLLPGLLLLALPACATGLPSEYSAEAIEAWVIDAETNLPLQDVIVVAHWRLEGGIHANHVGELMILETVTDTAGRFYFPAWGPKKILRMGSLLGGLPLNTHLDDAELLLFKSGYKYRGLTNPEWSYAKAGDSLRRSDWHGKTIAMKKFEGSKYEPKYEDNFEHFNGELERIAVRHPKACGWKMIPNTIRAMNQERRRLVGQGVNPNTLSTIDEDLLSNDKYYVEKGGCGSPKEYFGGFQ